MHAVYCEPWAIKPAFHAQIRRILEARISGEKEINLEDFLPERRLEGMEMTDGVAIIPVYGVMGHKVSLIEKSSGVASLQEIAANVKAAAEMPDVAAIMLDIDSPGGSVMGLEEASAAVQRANETKPVFAYTDGLMDSAAYHLAVGAAAIYASQSAEVGNVGTYMYLLDSSAAYERAGMKPELIKSGEFKGLGVEGLPLSDKQREYLQGIVDFHADRFRQHVQENRNGGVADEDLQGQFFPAPIAKDKNFIDGVASFDEALSELKHYNRLTTKGKI